MRNFVEPIENLTALDGVCGAVSARVARVTGSRAVKNALSGTWLGHPLHPALSDVPIGAWVMASLVDLSAGTAGARTARFLVGTGVAAAAPTAAAGAADWSDCYGATQRVGLVHAACNATASVLQAVSWLARRRGRRGVGVLLSGVGLSLTLSSAYLGGHLSYVRGVGVNHTAFQEPGAEWTDVAAEADLVEERPLRVDAGGVPVVVVRHKGRLYALSATCTHAGGPLDEGKLVVAACLRCPWHGSVFRLADGEVERGPASVAEPVWDVKTEGGRVHVRADGGG